MDNKAQRRRLFAIAYRMTGSRADAEDIVQETLVRWLKADRAEVRSSEAFLTTIATRLSLNHLRARRARHERDTGDWLPEPVDTGETDRLDEISFAFLTLLERLSPLQRAIFVLHSAFECDYGEIAEILGRDEAACRKAFSRARAAIRAEGPQRPAAREKHRALLGDFLEAIRRGDLEGVTALLTDDVVMRGDGGATGPALKKSLLGAAAVARFVLASRALLAGGEEMAVERLNGSDAAVFRANGRVVLAILIECADDRIARIFALADPAKLNPPARA
jgi:RNA polymerase sigma-70 factor (ECF subfamily)